MPKYHYAMCINFHLRMRLMGCCRDIFWNQCSYLSALTLRREAKPITVHYHDVYENYTPECDATRTCSMVICRETSPISQRWGPGKMIAIWWMTFPKTFLEWKCFHFYQNLTEVCSQVPAGQNDGIGTDNGLAPYRRQAIIWTNVA